MVQVSARALTCTICMYILYRSWGWMCTTSETCWENSVIKTALNNLHQTGPNKTHIWWCMETQKAEVFIWNHNGCLWLYLHNFTFETFPRFSRGLVLSLCDYRTTERGTCNSTQPQKQYGGRANLGGGSNTHQNLLFCAGMVILEKNMQHFFRQCVVQLTPAILWLWNNSMGVRFYCDTSWITVVLLLAQQPPVGQGLLIHEASTSHKTRHHSR